MLGCALGAADGAGATDDGAGAAGPGRVVVMSAHATGLGSAAEWWTTIEVGEPSRSASEIWTTLRDAPPETGVSQTGSVAGVGAAGEAGGLGSALATAALGAALGSGPMLAPGPTVTALHAPD